MIARFAGLALTCDVCGEQYVDLAESPEFGAALDALAAVMASASTRWVDGCGGSDGGMSAAWRPAVGHRGRSADRPGLVRRRSMRTYKRCVRYVSHGRCEDCDWGDWADLDDARQHVRTTGHTVDFEEETAWVVAPITEGAEAP